jgi:drug/metabolite transporter (DMT)-like permease
MLHPMSHRFAVVLLVMTTLMWSVSGLITRFLDRADGFEAVFWRSLFAVIVLLAALAWLRGPRGLVRASLRGGVLLWTSGSCWAIMFTAFVLALTLTSVANVLVTIAISPFTTALLARIALGHHIPGRTSIAILMATVGVFCMYAGEVTNTEARHVAGMAIALVIPVAAAVNLTLLQYVARQRALAKPDMLLAVFLGAGLATLVSLPAALPLRATLGDAALLGILGTVALAMPCLLLVVVSRVLSAPEISLYSMLEVVFGITWVWIVVNEAPSEAVFLGGSLVLAALALNEVLALRSQRKQLMTNLSDV